MNFRKLTLKQLTEFINSTNDLKLLELAEEEYVNRVMQTESIYDPIEAEEL